MATNSVTDGVVGPGGTSPTVVLSSTDDDISTEKTVQDATSRPVELIREEVDVVRPLKTSIRRVLESDDDEPPLVIVDSTIKDSSVVRRLLQSDDDEEPPMILVELGDKGSNAD